MMIKTSEATPRQLNWLAAKCEGIVWEQGDLDAGEYGPGFSPATDWAHGGPVIEREEVELTFDRPNETDTLWRAEMFDLKGVSIAYEYGPTPLIAAMRCYVASKLGDEIEIPEELK
jgi:hypothetical protein